MRGQPVSDVKTPFYGNVKRYADSGGRIFASHLHFNWLWTRPGAVAHDRDLHRRLAGGNRSAGRRSTATVDTTFPKGAALADWLVAVGATPTRGQIALYDRRTPSRR